jgi:NTP pyrophosphatase (non-canonical NTP hydrolase)
MPFRIGSDHCPGFSKLTEEMGELQQVIGKIEGFGGFGVHWDGQNLGESLEKEIADVLAAIEFVTAKNIDHLSRQRISRRKWVKYERFRMWHDNVQSGRPPNEGVVYEPEED